jgi:hypothetical protein
MQNDVPDPAVKMRILVAQLRAHAAETSIGHFRHKFRIAASELEEQAVDTESRVRFRETRKLAS